MPTPFTDEALIISGICACLTTETDRVVASIDSMKLALVAAIQAFDAENDSNLNTLHDRLHTYFNNVLGTVGQRDGGRSLITWAQEIVGATSDHKTNSPGQMEESLLTLTAHTHSRHKHPEDRTHQASDLSLLPQGNRLGPDNPLSAFFPTQANLLIMEFFGNQDLDGGAGSGDSASDSPPLNNSIYGHDGGFQLNETNDDFPAILEAVHAHPQFASPPIVLTYAEYLATL